MLGLQVNSSGIQQYQQAMRSSGDLTVGPMTSQGQRGDGLLQYDTSSFPLLSAGGSRFSGLPMQQMREEDFTIQNEDFPALPGSHGDRNSQKHGGDINGMIGGMMSGGGGIMGQGPQGIDRLRELSQENLQLQMHEQMMSQGQNSQSKGPAVARGGMAQQNIAVGGAVGNSGSDTGIGGNNSMANGTFLGIGVGGGMGMQSGHMGGNISNSNSSIGSGGGGSMSKEGGYGLSGLLDVIRMTDKDLNTLALGSDLTTFGLNLNSSDCLYSSFRYPPDSLFPSLHCHLSTS